MTVLGTHIQEERLRRKTETVVPPPWVAELLGDAAVSERVVPGPARLIERGPYLLASLTVPGVEALSAEDLQEAVCAAYLKLGAVLQRSQRHAIRLWNYIPAIHARMGRHEDGLLDRYMVFNAGRFAAYGSWYGKADVGPRTATATGIGHTGAELHIHCLAGAAAGEPLENPRQVPAYRYSKRRGPIPPCFARAMRVEIGGAPTLLVGGTASVRGESSVCLGNVEGQAFETFANMARLVNRGLACDGACAEPENNGRKMAEDDVRVALSRYRTLRVYCVHEADLLHLRDLVRGFFPGVKTPEFWRADVCRRTLLVEIEGTADLAQARNGSGQCGVRT